MIKSGLALRRALAMSAALAAAATASAAEGDTITFIVSDVTANMTKSWHDPGNWDLGRLPEAGDIVVLPRPTVDNYKICTTSVTNAVPATGKFKKVTVAPQQKLLFSGWETKISAEEMVLEFAWVTKAEVTCAPCTSSETNRVWIVADTLTVEKTAVISAKGFVPLSADPWLNGPCWDGVASPTGAPAHGGYGAPAISGMTSATVNNAVTCGSLTAPLLPGSSGGRNVGISPDGGGAIRIEAQTVTVNGSISANGTGTPYGSANGAGGSIYITCQTIAGSGTVSAEGGGNDAASNSPCGGGGRISVVYDPALQRDVACDVQFSARGGYAKALSNDRNRILARCGTLYFSDDTFARRPGVHLSGKVFFGSPATPLSIDTAGDFAITNSLLEVCEGGYVRVGGDLILNGTAVRKNGLWTSGGAPVEIGGDVIAEGAMLRAEGNVSVAGDLTLVEAATPMASGEVYVTAAPTNGTSAAYGSAVSVGGTWTIGANCAYFPACDPTNGAVVVATAKNFVIQAGGEVNADGLGWGPKCGPGSAGVYYAVSASYGGKGGASSAGNLAYVKEPYGNRERPLDPGSGSGVTSDWTGAGGGGLVWLEVERRLVIDGSISANGLDMGVYSSCSSGGGVYLVAGRFLGGAGSVTAGGGVSESASVRGGCGGGGRVAIICATDESDAAFKARVTAKGGFYSGKAADDPWQGQDGTVYWKERRPATVFTVQ